MLIIKQHRIFRKDIQANRNLLYVFGDNLMRVGTSGQALEMRGESNSFGVATKRGTTHGYPKDYFIDGQEDIPGIIEKEFDHLRAMAFNYKAIVIPMDGLGTGFSKLPEYAPIALNMINIKLKELEKL